MGYGALILFNGSVYKAKCEVAWSHLGKKIINWKKFLPLCTRVTLTDSPDLPLSSDDEIKDSLHWVKNKVGGGADGDGKSTAT